MNGTSVTGFALNVEFSTGVITMAIEPLNFMVRSEVIE